MSLKYIGESGENWDIIFSCSLSAHSLISFVLSAFANYLQESILLCSLDLHQTSMKSELHWSFVPLNVTLNSGRTGTVA